MSKVEQVAVRVLDDPASLAERSDVTAESEAPSRATRRETGRGGERAAIAIGIRKTGSLPELHAAADGATRFAEWAMKSQGIPQDRVTLITDDEDDVTLAHIYSAVASSIRVGSIEQLVIYFAGYAINVSYGEQWLLSRAPDDRGAAVDVSGSVSLARYAGIPHVVFVSDTCRASAESSAAQGVLGQQIFANLAASGQATPVDQFRATPVGRPAFEITDVAAAARQYRAAYTTVLLSALGGAERSIQEERDGVMFIRPRSLQAFLARAVPEYLRSLGITVEALQTPDAIIESGLDAWLAAFETPPA